LLVQKVVEQHPGKVRFVSENFGASKLAQRFGVTRYPAVFVNDILVARPRDFGFVGAGEETGRYTPWRDSSSQARFQADLERMVEKVLAGKQAELRKESARATAQAAASGAGDDLAQLPSFALTDLAGRPLAKEQLAGRVVLVEFWATWCPPCRSTLEWLGTLQQKYGDKIAVVALAVESPEDQVRATTAKLNPQLRWAMADGPTARAFGGIVAVPTLFLFDRTGKTVRVLYGAPPDLHQVAERALATAAR
jgi:thiol-disulfide isomerase/thioredoxin